LWAVNGFEVLNYFLQIRLTQTKFTFGILGGNTRENVYEENTEKDKQES